MHISVVGTGYVGLVSGVCFAKLGFRVTCIDRIPAKIATLKAGLAPFYEPGLSELMEEAIQARRLDFALSLDEVPATDVIFIAVGTPPSAEGIPDMTAIWSVADAIGKSKHREALVVVKSTVPPGTTRALRSYMSNNTASNPEFLREGAAISDFMQPDRVVCGIDSEQARTLLEALYAPLDCPVFFTSPESSEMIKYAANDLLASRIAYINEMADICETIGADIEDVARGMGMDKRIGSHFLKAGPGYGGSCFPKDVLALAQLARNAGVPSLQLESTIASNDARKQRMAEKIITACGNDVRGKKLAILGVTFKANTDDMREAASLSILPRLLEAGAALSVYDPQGNGPASALIQGDIRWCDSTADALMGADAAVILTEWSEFAALDLSALAQRLSLKLLVDLRNLYNPAEVAASGLRYVSVGRPAASDGQVEVSRHGFVDVFQPKYAVN